MENFTIGQLLYTAQQNKKQIVAYFQNKETYDDKNDLGKTFGNILILAIFIGVVLYIIAAILLIKFWGQLSDTSKIVGVFGILPIVPFGPVVTLIAIGVGRKA